MWGSGFIYGKDPVQINHGKQTTGTPTAEGQVKLVRPSILKETKRPRTPIRVPSAQTLTATNPHPYPETPHFPKRLTASGRRSIHSPAYTGHAAPPKLSPAPSSESFGLAFGLVQETVSVLTKLEQTPENQHSPKLQKHRR